MIFSTQKGRKMKDEIKFVLTIIFILLVNITAVYVIRNNNDTHRISS
jgi:hypothetical protein